MSNMEDIEYEYKIIPRNGEYEVYVNNELKCSKNTMIEAIDELEKLMFKVGM